MSVILSPGLVVDPSSPLPARHPMVAWQSNVLFSNLSADSEAAGYPVTNLANPSTANRWMSGSTAEQLITISDLLGVSDYVAMARHNFGTAGISVSVEGRLSGGDWEELFPGTLPADDSPLVLRFVSNFYSDLRLRLVPDAVEPYAAVLFAGEGLVMVRPMQPGFTPIRDAKSYDMVAGWSQSGEMLGVIVDGAKSSNSASFVLLEATWYRDNMRAFVEAANLGSPFFFAWNPELQPDDVAYCVFSSGDVQPALNYMNGKYIDITLPMTAVAI